MTGKRGLYGASSPGQKRSKEKSNTLCMVPAYDLSPTMETEKFVHGRADRPGLKINPKCSCRSDSLRVFFALASTCGGALYVSICPEEIPKRAEPVKDMGKGSKLENQKKTN
jgi:hypothetical protein